MVEEIVGRADRPCVLAFDASVIHGKALNDLNALVVKIGELDGNKKKDFHIVIFGSAGQEPVGLLRTGSVTFLQRSAATIDEQIKREFPGAYISIALQRRQGDAMSDILGDFKSRDPSSYVVLEQEQKADIVGQVNIASLLYMVSVKKPCGIFVGRFRGKDFNQIQETLRAIGGLYRMLTDIGKAISEIFQSIKAVSVSA
jgi:hypothetical protein